MKWFGSWADPGLRLSVNYIEETRKILDNPRSADPRWVYSHISSWPIMSMGEVFSVLISEMVKTKALDGDKQ